MAGYRRRRGKLDCSVCLQKFHTPKLLPCFHTFCLRCLERMAKANDVGWIACPLCNTRVPIPNGGVRNFQTNFYIDSDSGCERELTPLPTPTSAHPKSPRGCDACGELRGLRNHKCDECDSFLCDSCERLHRQDPRTRNHTIIRLRRVRTPKTPFGSTPAFVFGEEVCRLHADVIRYYCFRCDVPMCQDCKASHEGHGTEGVLDSGQNRCQLEDLKQELDDQMTQLSRSTEELELQESYIRDSAQDVIDEIEKRATVLINLVQKFKHEEQERVDAVRKRELKNLRQQKSEVAGNAREVKSTLSRINYVLECGTGLDILKTVGTSRAKLQGLSGQVRRHSSTSEVAIGLTGPSFVSVGDVGKLFQTVIVQTASKTISPSLVTFFPACSTPQEDHVTESVCAVGDGTAWVCLRRSGDTDVLFALVSDMGEVLCEFPYGAADSKVDLFMLRSKIFAAVRSTGTVLSLDKSGVYVCKNAARFPPLCFAATRGGSMAYCVCRGREGRLQLVSFTDMAGDAAASRVSFPLPAPSCLAVGEDGSLAAIDVDQRLLHLASRTGAVSWTYSGEGRATELPFQPSCVCAAAANSTVYVADVSSSAIHEVDMAGNFVRTLLTSDAGLDLPQVVTLDPVGNLWIAGAGAKIWVFSLQPKTVE